MITNHSRIIQFDIYLLNLFLGEEREGRCSLVLLLFAFSI